VTLAEIELNNRMDSSCRSDDLLSIVSGDFTPMSDDVAARLEAARSRSARGVAKGSARAIR
jgi:hypothetical protein